MKHNKWILTSIIITCLIMFSPTVLLSLESTKTDTANDIHRVALKFSSLPIVAQSLCPTDLINGRMSLTATAGTVIPISKFEVTTPYNLEILGETLSFSRTGGSNYVGYKNNIPSKIGMFRDGLVDIPVGTVKKGTVISIPVVTDTKEGYTAYYRSGSVAVGNVGKDRVFIYDNNLNGSYAIGEDMFSVGSGVVFASLGKWLSTTEGLMNAVRERN